VSEKLSESSPSHPRFCVSCATGSLPCCNRLLADRVPARGQTEIKIMQNFCARRNFEEQGSNSRTGTFCRKVASLPRAGDFVPSRRCTPTCPPVSSKHPVISHISHIPLISFRASPASIHAQTLVHIFTNNFLLFGVQTIDGELLSAIEAKSQSTFSFTKGGCVCASKPSS
jgi:hypothetical protein